MPTNVQFRPIMAEDRETLYQIYASTRTEELSVVPWSDADKDRFLRMQFHAQTSHYEKHFSHAEFQLLLIGDKPAGRLYVDQTGPQILIVDISLLPAFRGQGIGTSILQDLIARSISAGKSLIIHVEKNNPAKRLYHRLGFIETQDLGVYDLMVHQPLARA
jgi:ribosomal protein S18 acetylase RimI-like enzyme